LLSPSSTGLSRRRSRSTACRLVPGPCAPRTP
jgi:hypothetical protein